MAQRRAKKKSGVQQPDLDGALQAALVFPKRSYYCHGGCLQFFEKGVEHRSCPRGIPHPGDPPRQAWLVGIAKSAYDKYECAVVAVDQPAAEHKNDEPAAAASAQKNTRSKKRRNVVGAKPKSRQSRRVSSDDDGDEAVGEEDGDVDSSDNSGGDGGSSSDDDDDRVSKRRRHSDTDRDKERSVFDPPPTAKARSDGSGTSWRPGEHLHAIGELRRLMDVLTTAPPSKPTVADSRRIITAVNAVVTNWQTGVINSTASEVPSVQCAVEQAVEYLRLSANALTSGDKFDWSTGVQDRLSRAADRISLAITMAGVSRTVNAQTSPRAPTSTTPSRRVVDLTDSDSEYDARDHDHDDCGRRSRPAGAHSKGTTRPDMTGCDSGDVISIEGRPGTAPTRFVRLRFDNLGIAMSPEFGSKTHLEHSTAFTRLLASRLRVAEVIARDPRVRDSITAALFTPTDISEKASSLFRSQFLSGSVPCLSTTLSSHRGDFDSLRVLDAATTIMRSQSDIFGQREALVLDITSAIATVRTMLKSSNPAAVVAAWDAAVRELNADINSFYNDRHSGLDVHASVSITSEVPFSPFQAAGFRSFTQLVRLNFDDRRTASVRYGRSNFSGQRRFASVDRSMPSRRDIASAVDDTDTHIIDRPHHRSRSETPVTAAKRTVTFANDRSDVPHGVCKHWWTGRCARGSQCRFKHPEDVKGKGKVVSTGDSE